MSSVNHVILFLLKQVPGELIPLACPSMEACSFPCLGLAGSVHSGPFASPGWAACYTTDFVELNDRSCLWH